MARRRLRPAGFDDLGLRRALSDRLLPALIGAVAFLAVLAMAGAVAASGLAAHWQAGAGSAATVQVPRPTEHAAEGHASRVDAVMAALRDAPGIAQARRLTSEELSALLRPWLGQDAGRLSLPLPAVVDLRLDRPAPDLAALTKRLDRVAPGTLLEAHAAWMHRLSALARSLQACAAAALLLVGLVAAAVIAVAIRAGLAARRDAIEIVHGLGATDSYIARRFAHRATTLAALGAACGAVAALPVLLGLATLAAPFAAGPQQGAAGLLPALPAALWLTLPALPVVAGVIGWLTAHATVRGWLRSLP